MGNRMKRRSQGHNEPLNPSLSLPNEINNFAKHVNNINTKVGQTFGKKQSRILPSVHKGKQVKLTSHQNNSNKMVSLISADLNVI